MKSKALSSDKKMSRQSFISTALLRENMRKLWPLSILITLVFIIPTLFIFLLKDHDYARLHGENLLNNSNFVHMIAYIIFPVIISVIVFKYLYRQGSISVLHSMPFTRRTLFCSNWLSGFMVLAVPVLINTALLFPVANHIKSIAGTQNQDISIIGEASRDGMIPASTPWFELYSPYHVVNWLIISLLIMAFIYALSCLAGMLTGTVTMHIICALLINYAPMFLFFMIGSYLNAELSGFDLSSFISNNIKWFSPIWDSNGTMSGLRWTMYIAVIVLSIFLSAKLYKHRHLERAGDSLIFKFADHIAVFLITLTATAFIGLYVYSYSNVGVIFYTGLAAASLIFLLIASMIVQKTPRIFNRKTLADIVVYALILGAFTLCISHDVFGVETRVPNAENVSYVKLNAPVLSNKPFREGSDIYDDYFSEKSYTFKSREAIDSITAFQKDLVSDPETLRKAGNISYDMLEEEWRMNLEYHLDSGKTINRVYNITNADFENNKNLIKLLETDEYKQNLTFENLGYDRIMEISFNFNSIKSVDTNPDNTSSDFDEEYTGSYNYITEGGQFFLHGDEREELLKCLDRDFMEQTAEELNSSERPLANLMVSVKSDSNRRLDNQDFYDASQTINYVISSTYDHTIQWLKDKGYYDKLIFTADDISNINVEVVEDDDVIKSYNVTDRTEIESLYNAGSTSLTNGYEFAVLSIELTDSGKRKLRNIGLTSNGEGGGESRGEMEKNIARYNNINRLYIEKNSETFKELIR